MSIFLAGLREVHLVTVASCLRKALPVPLIREAEHGPNLLRGYPRVISAGARFALIARRIGRVLALHKRLLIVASHPGEALVDAFLLSIPHSRFAGNDELADELVETIRDPRQPLGGLHARWADQTANEFVQQATRQVAALRRFAAALDGCRFGTVRYEEFRQDWVQATKDNFSGHQRNLEGVSVGDGPDLARPGHLAWPIWAEGWHGLADEPDLHRYCDLFGYAPLRQTGTGADANMREDVVRPVVGAINTTRQRLCLPPFTPGTSSLSEAERLVAASHLERSAGQTGRALDLAQAAHEMDPGSSAARLCLAGLHVANDPARAVALLSAATIDGEREQRSFGLALIAAHCGLGRPDLALVTARELSSRNQAGGADSLFAEVAFCAGDTGLARSHAERALGDDGVAPEKAVACARILARAGARDTAIRLLRDRLDRVGGTEAEWRLLIDPDDVS